MKDLSKKYEYDKALSLFYTTNKYRAYPDWLLHYFETDEEAKAFALHLIKSDGYEDYEIIEERFLKDLPGFQPGLKLYEIRIGK